MNIVNLPRDKFPFHCWDDESLVNVLLSIPARWPRSKFDLSNRVEDTHTSPTVCDDHSRDYPGLPVTLKYRWNSQAAVETRDQPNYNFNCAKDLTFCNRLCPPRQVRIALVGKSLKSLSDSRLSQRRLSLQPQSTTIKDRLSSLLIPFPISCNTNTQRNEELAIKLELIIRACFYRVEYHVPLIFKWYSFQGSYNAIT